MVFNNPTIERDEHVVASKLPRIEFANFKKLCDLEGKTPSGKIRELINKEVDEKFGNFYTSNYDEEKVRQFQINTLNDYNSSKIIEKICKVNLVERTDGKFMQVGLRPLIEEDIFLPEGNVHPALPSFGRQIAVGERDLLIQNILENEDIKRIKLDKSKIQEFSKEIDFSESIVLISNDYYVELAMALMHRIEYKNKEVVLDSHHKLFFVPGEFMKNKIIVIKKEAVLWAKEKFYNKYSDKEESLDISIKALIGGKVDILARSVNRMKYIDTEGIKILEVKE